MAIRERAGEAAAKGARALLEWARRNGLTIIWDKGADAGSFSPRLEGAAGPYWSVTCYSYGRVEVQFGHMKVGPFAPGLMGHEAVARSVGERPRVRFEGGH